MTFIFSRPDGLWRSVARVAALVAGVIFLSGCPALFIPGLIGSAGYQLYKYEKRSPDPAAGSGQNRHHRDQRPSQQSREWRQGSRRLAFQENKHLNLMCYNPGIAHDGSDAANIAQMKIIPFADSL